eukprot:5183989-Prymnesium_polylepis.1
MPRCSERQYARLLGFSKTWFAHHPQMNVKSQNPGEAVDEAEMDETEQAERMAEAIGADSL